MHTLNLRSNNNLGAAKTKQNSKRDVCRSPHILCIHSGWNGGLGWVGMVAKYPNDKQTQMHQTHNCSKKSAIRMKNFNNEFTSRLDWICLKQKLLMLIKIQMGI